MHLRSLHHILHASLELVEVLLAAGALPYGTDPQVSSSSHTITVMHNLCIFLCCESAVTQLLQSQLGSSSSLQAVVSEQICCIHLQVLKQ